MPDRCGTPGKRKEHTDVNDDYDSTTWRHNCGNNDNHEDDASGAVVGDNNDFQAVNKGSRDKYHYDCSGKDHDAEHHSAPKADPLHRWKILGQRCMLCMPPWQVC